MGELRGARALASETSRAVRDARTRSRSPEGGRRGPRAKRDPIYAELLDRRDQNAERLREARERQYFHDAEEFLGTKSPQSRPSPGSGRSPGRPIVPGCSRPPRARGPIPRLVLVLGRRRGRRRAGREGDGGRPRVGSARRSVANSRRRVDLSLGRRARRRIARLAARRPEPPVRVPSPRDAVVPRLDTGSTTTTATRLRSGATSRTRLRRRARARVVPPRHSAKTTTTFDPPRLFTSSRPMERVRNRRAMERAWRRQELTESVVMRTVGTLAGEPGLRKHWDDPLRAAAEQAAAKVASEEGIAATSETARAAARRAAAAAARLVDAELLSSDGDSPEGRSLKGRAKRAYLGDVAAALRDPSGSPRYPDRFHVDAREDRPRGFESDDGASGDEGENIDDGEGLGRRRVRRFRARTRRRRRRGRPRAISPGLARRSLALRSLASRVGSHLALATETTACDVPRRRRPSAANPAARLPPPRPPPPSDDPYSNRPIARGRFLRSGHGGAGMARGRSVAAMEEFSNPEHAARLRRSLETSAGPALAAARAEQARAAARVGHARARARREAEAAAKAEAAARGAPIRSKETARVCGAGASIRRAGLRARIHRRRVTRQRGASTVGREAPSRREPTRVLLETPLGAPLGARSRPLVRISTSTCPLRATGARSSARRRRPCTRQSRARTARTTPPRDSRRRTDAR